MEGITQTDLKTQRIVKRRSVMVATLIKKSYDDYRVEISSIPVLSSFCESHFLCNSGIVFREVTEYCKTRKKLNLFNSLNDIKSDHITS